jgi:hypothetical protein
MEIHPKAGGFVGPAGIKTRGHVARGGLPGADGEVDASIPPPFEPSSLHRPITEILPGYRQHAVAPLAYGANTEPYIRHGTDWPSPRHAVADAVLGAVTPRPGSPDFNLRL